MANEKTYLEAINWFRKHFQSTFLMFYGRYNIVTANTQEIDNIWHKTSKNKSLLSLYVHILIYVIQNKNI